MGAPTITMPADNPHIASELLEAMIRADTETENVRITRARYPALIERLIRESAKDQSEEGKEKTRILESLRPRLVTRGGGSDHLRVNEVHSTDISRERAVENCSASRREALGMGAASRSGTGGGAAPDQPGSHPSSEESSGAAGRSWSETRSEVSAGLVSSVDQGAASKGKKRSWAENERIRKAKGRKKAGDKKLEAAEDKRAALPTGEAAEAGMLMQKPGWGGGTWPAELNKELADIDLREWPLTMHEVNGVR